MRKFGLVLSGLRRAKNRLASFSVSSKRELLDEKRVEKTSLSDIELILVNFYKDLYTKDSLDMQIQTELFDDLEISLTDLERDKCEGLFTNKELLTALKGLQTFLQNFILPFGMI